MDKRRQRLEKKVLPKLTELVRYAAGLDAPLPVLIESVKAQGLEGLVAKRLDSPYESDKRSGAWMKLRNERPLFMDSQAKHVTVAAGVTDLLMRFPPDRTSTRRSGTWRPGRS